MEQAMKKLFINSRLLASNFLGRLRTRFREYADRCVESGFLPRRFVPLQILTKYLSRVWVYVQVGRIRIIGAENLTPEGHIIFNPNHSSMFDALILCSIMKRQPRYMTAYEQMKGWRGLKQVLMGAAGAFPVDRKRGRTAIKPAVDALVNEKYLVIFPEAKISESGEYLKFKTGSAYIAISACAVLGQDVKVGIAPINICYNKRDNATAGSGFGEMGFKWRHGATVTIGAPIYIQDVRPLNRKKVTQVVRQAIVQQQCSTASDSLTD
jgi:1-acyl-sn-glycerol-3-phosphate acyltransferase